MAGCLLLLVAFVAATGSADSRMLPRAANPICTGSERWSGPMGGVCGGNQNVDAPFPPVCPEGKCQEWHVRHPDGFAYGPTFFVRGGSSTAKEQVIAFDGKHEVAFSASGQVLWRANVTANSPVVLPSGDIVAFGVSQKPHNHANLKRYTPPDANRSVEAVLWKLELGGDVRENVGDVNPGLIQYDDATSSIVAAWRVSSSKDLDDDGTDDPAPAVPIDWSPDSGAVSGDDTKSFLAVIDAESGALQWGIQDAGVFVSTYVGTPGTLPILTMPDGSRALLTSRSSSLELFDLKSGATVWNATLPHCQVPVVAVPESSRKSEPSDAAGMAVVFCRPADSLWGHFLGVNLNDGSVAWTLENNATLYLTGSFSIAGDVLMLGGIAGGIGVWAVDIHTGTILWRKQWRAYAGAMAGSAKLFCVIAESNNGMEAGRDHDDTFDDDDANPAWISRLFCMDPPTGKVLTEVTIHGQHSASAGFLSSGLVFVTFDKTLDIVDPSAHPPA